MYNIRRVRELNRFVTIDGFRLQAVLFDTDVDIEGVAEGADSAGRVPALGQLGWIQRLVPGNPASAGDLPHAVLARLLDEHGPVGGPLDCVVNINGSGQTMRVHSLYTETALTPDFAVPVYGAPALPGNRQWSLARIRRTGTTAGVVEPIDPRRGVPLIRQDNSAIARFADSVDLLSPASPHSDYALLHTSPTHRILFPRPTVEGNEPALRGVQPLLADPYSMLSAVGLFPNENAALRASDASWILDLVPGGLKTRSPITVPPPPAPKRLTDAGSWSIDVLYSDTDGRPPIRINIDPSLVPDLAAPGTLPVHMPQVASILNVDGIGELFRIVCDAPDLGGLPARFTEPRVGFGSILDDLREIFSALKDVKLPGNVDVSLDGSGLDNQTFRLRFAARIRLATRSGDRIDVGIGKLYGELRFGADLDIALGGPARGRIFFEIGGDLQQGIIPPLLYAGGLLRFSLAIDHLGKPDWRLDAGVVGSIGGDLLKGLVSLEGTVHYAYLLRPDLSPGARIGMQARAKVLDGFLGVKFGIDAAVNVSRPNGADLDEVRLKGDVTALGQFTVAWAFEKEFSQRISFDQTIKLRYVALAAFQNSLVVPA